MDPHPETSSAESGLYPGKPVLHKQHDDHPHTSHEVQPLHLPLLEGRKTGPGRDLEGHPELHKGLSGQLGLDS